MIVEVSSLCCSSAAQRCCSCCHRAQTAWCGAALCALSWWKKWGKIWRRKKKRQFGCAEELCMCALCAYKGRLWAHSIVHVSMIRMVPKSLASTSAVEMLRRFFYYYYLKKKKKNSSKLLLRGQKHPLGRIQSVSPAPVLQGSEVSQHRRIPALFWNARCSVGCCFPVWCGGCYLLTGASCCERWSISFDVFGWKIVVVCFFIIIII